MGGRTDVKVMAMEKDARIMHRRSLSAARHRALQLSLLNRPISFNDEKDDVKFNVTQLSSSLTTLASIMASFGKAINSYRTNVYDKENSYVSAQKNKRKCLEDEIEKIGVSCKEKLNDIASNWIELSSVNGPQELAKKISNQTEAYKGLLETKNKLIESIQEDLRIMDEDYQQTFRQQSKDVDNLIIIMNEQVSKFQEADIRELSVIEDDFMDQRKNILQRNKTEMDLLIKKVESTEISLKEKKVSRLEEHTKSLDIIRAQDAEDYVHLKVRLETGIQTLEQHLESLQIAYQLNSEKLDYNYRVLVEREHDNYITAGQQKRKLTKQWDTLCTLKGRYLEHERQFLLQNGKLGVEYEKVIKLLQDLQSKENQLRSARDRQHVEFFFMHQHSLAVLTSKVLQADKLITEQHLGWKWHPPSDIVFRDLSSMVSLKPTSRKENISIKNDVALFSSQDLPMQIAESPENSSHPHKRPDSAEDSFSNFSVKSECNSVSYQDVDLLVSANTSYNNVSSGGIEAVSEEVAFHSQKRTQKEEMLQSIELNGEDNPQVASVEGSTEKTNLIFRQSEFDKGWRDYGAIMKPKTFHIWAVFEVALLSYNQLLKNRLALMQEVWLLYKQNKQLNEALLHCSKNEV